jgi:sulfur-oxidizing protein SoxX
MKRPGAAPLLRRSAAGALALCVLGPPTPFAQQPIFDGDAIREPLTPTPGDPVRGKAVLVQREKGHCILCHALPEPDVRFAGNIGPPLAGVGVRLSVAQIRGRIADPTRHAPDTVMPAYFRTAGLRRVAPAFRERTVLSAQDVEDAVAYLSTLR